MAPKLMTATGGASVPKRPGSSATLAVPVIVHRVLLFSNGRHSYTRQRQREALAIAFVAVAITIFATGLHVTTSIDGTIWRGDGGTLYVTLPADAAESIGIGDKVEVERWRGEVRSIDARDRSTIVLLEGPTLDAPRDFERAQLRTTQKSLIAFAFDTVRDLLQEV